MAERAKNVADKLGLTTDAFPIRENYGESDIERAKYEGDMTKFFNNLIRENCGIAPRLR